MQTETSCKNKYIINILMASMTVLLLVIFVFDIKLDCIFLKYLHIKCPACGLTRSFEAILNLDLVSAFKENIFGIPLFFSIIIIYIIYFIDLILKKNILGMLYTKFSKHYIVIILVLVILTVLNNIL